MYDNVAYSDTVCSDMECVDIRNPTMCISKTADDGTPCGNKKVNIFIHMSADIIFQFELEYFTCQKMEEIMIDLKMGFTFDLLNRCSLYFMCLLIS